jgi:MFS family permease
VAIAALVACSALALETERTPPARMGRPARPRLERALIAVGILGAAAFLVEGGTESWSALFLERQLDASPSVSGLGPGLFGAAMAAGRFATQAAGRFPDRTLLSAGGAVAAAGCALAAVAPNPPVALAGFALAGAGISVTAPVIFGAAGRGRRDAASAVATVTTIGYLGLLVGPPLVGGVAQALSLRASFFGLALVAAAVAVAALRAGRGAV